MIGLFPGYENSSRPAVLALTYWSVENPSLQNHGITLRPIVNVEYLI